MDLGVVPYNFKPEYGEEKLWRRIGGTENVFCQMVLFTSWIRFDLLSFAKECKTGLRFNTMQNVSIHHLSPTFHFTLSAEENPTLLASCKHVDLVGYSTQGVKRKGEARKIS